MLVLLESMIVKVVPFVLLIFNFNTKIIRTIFSSLPDLSTRRCYPTCALFGWLEEGEKQPIVRATPFDATLVRIRLPATALVS